MKRTLIPMFPLTLLPLPQELVPLHIFEPRYKQLLHDAEATDLNFGIYFNHTINELKLGSLVRLESVIKRYPDGKLDIIVRCVDLITLDKLYRTYKEKLYPGGDVHYQDVNTASAPGQELYELFLHYRTLQKMATPTSVPTIWQLAHELVPDIHDRYKFLTLSDQRRENFLKSQLKFQLHVLLQENKLKDVFHLN